MQKAKMLTCNYWQDKSQVEITDINFIFQTEIWNKTILNDAYRNKRSSNTSFLRFVIRFCTIYSSRTTLTSTH